jgi:serine/threonine protein kinase
MAGSNEHRNALSVGTALDGYVISRILGAGGFGITYEAEEVSLGRKVAIKEFFPKNVAVRDGASSSVQPSNEGERDIFRWGIDRFRQEAKTLVALRHPNIVPVLRYFDANGTAYLVMEYQEGRSLAAVLKGAGTLDEAAILRIARPILDGLKAVHAANFLHRDLKPDNIYIRADGSPVLLDFGAARQAVGAQSRSLTAIVSEGYAPYEQYHSSGGQQGPWTDIYALGAVLYRCIAGERPTDAPTRISARVRGAPDPLKPAAEAGRGRYRARFLAAIDRALAVLETERPQTATAFARELLGDDGAAGEHTGVAAATSMPSVAPTMDVTPNEVPSGPSRPPSGPSGPSGPVSASRPGPTAPMSQPAAVPAPARNKKLVPIAAGVVALVAAAAAGGYMMSQPKAPATTAATAAAPLDPAAKAEAEARQRAEEAAKRAYEEALRKSREEAERKAREEAEARVKAEAEAKARAEAERKAKEEAAARAKAEAERARAEAERKAREEAEARVRAEAEAKARAEAERNAKEEAAARAKAESEARARAEAEAKTRAEAERKAKEEAEAKAKTEGERARAEAERARAEAERARGEAERRAREEAEKKAREEELSKRVREEVERRLAEEKRKREEAEAAARVKAEAEAKAKEEAERKAKEAAEAKAKAEAEAKAKTEAAEKTRARAVTLPSFVRPDRRAGSVFFGFQKSTLEPSAQNAIAQIAAAMNADAKTTLTLVAFAEPDEGEAAARAQLRQARLAAVQAALAQRGIAAARIKAGQGETTENLPRARRVSLALEGAAPAKPEEKKEVAGSNPPAAAGGEAERIAGASGYVLKEGNVTGGRNFGAHNPLSSRLTVRFLNGGQATLIATVEGSAPTGTANESGTWRLQGSQLCVAFSSIGGTACYAIAFAGNCFTLAGGGLLNGLRACK